jgi:hypothetical protein
MVMLKDDTCILYLLRGWMKWYEVITIPLPLSVEKSLKFIARVCFWGFCFCFCSFVFFSVYGEGKKQKGANLRKCPHSLSSHTWRIVATWIKVAKIIL